MLQVHEAPTAGRRLRRDAQTSPDQIPGNDPIPVEIPQPEPTPSQDPIPHQTPLPGVWRLLMLRAVSRRRTRR
ncbi:MAG: hypothetical protein JWP36_934 [Paucimonas sp.]|jgi:hypothetical protein|nr:hypothetical protein [Paucimonas sp.]